VSYRGCFSHTILLKRFALPKYKTKDKKNKNEEEGEKQRRKIKRTKNVTNSVVTPLLSFFV